MARILQMVGGRQRVRNVKNLGWFFRKARATEITRFDMWQSNDGWEMFVDFADGVTYQTNYASLEVFKRVMGRQRSLRGVMVTVHGHDSVRSFTLGKK